MPEVEHPRLDPKIASYFKEQDARTLRGWCAANGRRIEKAPENPMHGHTGSVLIPVYLTLSNGAMVKALLKYSPTGAVSPAEPAGHLDAHNASSAAFARDHLIEQLVDAVVLSDGGAVMFLHIAHGGLKSIATLHGLFESGGSLASPLRAVVRSVLEDWNPTPKLAPTTAAELLAEHLVEDIRPGDTFLRWVARHHGLRETQWFALPGRPTPVPNPLALLDRRVAAELEIRVHLGNAHGDLHLGNVIIPLRGLQQPEPARYRLIDLSTFRAAAPLARDPMFLLTSALLVHLPELGPRGRATALTMLVEPDRANRANVSDDLRRCVEGVWKAGLDWAKARALTDEWRAESLLSLASAALRHVPWAADPVDGWWFFQLACYASAEFLRHAEPNLVPAPDRVVPLADIAGPELTAAPRWRSAPGGAAAPVSPAVGATPFTSPRERRLTAAQITHLVEAILKVPTLRHQPLAWPRVAKRLRPPVEADGALRGQVSALVKRLNTQWQVDRWQRLLAALWAEAPHDREMAEVEQVLRLFGLTPPRVNSPR